MKKTVFSIFVLSIALLGFNKVNAQALTGNYSIGGTSPDYTDFTNAVSALNTNGVSAAVTFNVRPGTYNEQIEIDSIDGASANNTITFVGDTGVNQPLLTTSGSSSKNYTIYLNDASYITFKKLKIENTDTYEYGIVVDLGVESHDITFDSCYLTNTLTNGDKGFSLIYAYQTKDYNMVFSNNTLENGSYSFYMEGISNSSPSGRFTFKNNILLNPYSTAISFENAAEMTLLHNDISSNTSHNGDGIYALYSNNITIAYNKIYNTAGSAWPERGMYLERTGYGTDNNSIPSTVAANNIYNNFIQVGNSTDAIDHYGVYLYYVNDATNFYNNNINVLGTSTNNRAFSGKHWGGTGEGPTNVYNNIIKVEEGYAYYASGDLPQNIDYNDLYTEGANPLAKIGKIKYANLTKIQAAGKQLNSISIDPKYKTYKDLYPEEAQFIGTGINFNNLTDDIDGNTRDALYLGAAIIKMENIDAGISAINSPTIFCNLSSESVQVELTNYGNQPLSTVKIHWTVNGTAQTTKNWNGSLNALGAVTVTLGIYTFTKGDKLLAWTSSPNGKTDANPSNDTATVILDKTSLNGTYTIGGSNPDYADFSSAVSDLNNYGVCGAVIFNVRSGTYNGQTIINSINGASATNTITFIGNTVNQPVLTSSTSSKSDNYTIYLNDASYIAFKKLKMTNTKNDKYARVIDLGHESHNITVDNCYLKNNLDAIGENTYALIFADSSKDYDMVFTNNTLENGSYGFYARGVSQSSPSGKYTLKNNTVLNPYRAAFYLENAVEATILHNDISSNSAYTNGYGIRIEYSNNITIAYNKIYNTGTSIWPLRGMYIYYVGDGTYNHNIPSTVENNIYNNFIQVGNPSDATQERYGVYLYKPYDKINFYNNNINMLGSNTEIKAFYGDDLGKYSTISVYNNIFRTQKGYAYYISGVSPQNSDYNDLYTEETSKLARIGGTNYPDLATLQAASLQVNSVSTDPLYQSYKDLHIAANLINKGLYFNNLNDDIDGLNRNSSKPEIGAAITGFIADIYSITTDTWDKKTTWNCNCIPTKDNNVTISTGDVVTLTDSVQVMDLIISNNGTLDASASNYKIKLTGDWKNNGTFEKKEGTVVFNGSGSAQQLIGGVKTDFYNLTIDNSSGVQMTSDTVKLFGNLTLTNGTFVTNNKFIVASNKDYTGSIGTIPASSDITGNVTVQRYIKEGATNWRFLTSPVQGATLAEWKNDFIMSGFPGSGWYNWPSASNRWPSVYTYDETLPGSQDDGYIPATDISQVMHPGEGFWVYCGDKKSGTQPFIIDVKGPINKGTINIPVSYTDHQNTADGWNLVGNPYPSAIDWDKSTAWTKTHIDNAIYIWSTQDQQYSIYVNGAGINGGSQYIASGQGFYVKANAASPILKITEDAKVAVSQNPSFLRKSNPNQNLVLSITGNNGFSDETILRTNKNTSNAFDNGYDAYKMFSSNVDVPSISTVAQNEDFSINTFKTITKDTAIYLRTKVGVSGNYKLEIKGGKDFDASCLFLEDLLTKKMIDLSMDTIYQFNISDTTEAPRFVLHIGAPLNANTNAVSCFGVANGKIILHNENKDLWKVTLKDNQNNVVDSINGSMRNMEFSNLSAGTYFVKVNKNGLCKELNKKIRVYSPLKVLANFDAAADTLYLSQNATTEFKNKSQNAKKYIWNFDDGFESYDYSPSHTFLNSGNYNIKLTALQEDNCKDTVSKNIIVMGTSGINQNEVEDNDFNIYASSGYVYVNYELSQSQEINIRIFNMLGQMVYENSWKGKTVNKRIPLQSSGLYIVRLNGQNIHHVKKIEIIR